jgi:hypothetical protein
MIRIDVHPAGEDPTNMTRTLQGVEREAVTCFGVREKHMRGKGRRGCSSGCYEPGGERTGAGTSDVSTWRRRGGELKCAQQGRWRSSAGKGVDTTEAVPCRKRNRGTGWHAWPAEEEGKWAGPKRKRCRFFCNILKRFELIQLKK